jgi:hypothetical protein
MGGLETGAEVWFYSRLNPASHCPRDSAIWQILQPESFKELVVEYSGPGFFKTFNHFTPRRTALLQECSSKR